jgi:dolichyl-phosphate beta-glucosyltransferase
LDDNLEPITYSIILPAYNEAVRIGSTLEKILFHVKRRGWDAEVLVVNDGSSDDTRDVVRGYAAKNPMLRLIDNPGNRGKGYSVRNGMLRARGDILLFSDADLSSPIEEADKLFAAIENGADIAIGSRWLKPELQAQRQPIGRQILGRIFNLALRIILGFSRCNRSSVGDLTLKFFTWPSDAHSGSRKFRSFGRTAKARGSIHCATVCGCSQKS